MTRILFVILAILGISNSLSSQAVRNYSLEVSCKSSTINSTQSVLEFKWPYRSPSASAQYVYRKHKDRYDWGSVYATLGTNDSTFRDTVLTGVAYEYMFEKYLGPDGYPTYGFVYASHRFPAITNRGTIIMVVDSTHDVFLANSIRTYRNDLIGDGWKTILKWVSPSTTVAEIKSYIYSTYSADPTNIKSVVLIGNIAVPYSGDYSQYGIWPPDGHVSISGYGPSHEGAWPTDIYYGDMTNATWTDSLVTNTLGVRAKNNNVPNDGKFDVTELTDLVTLQVGRIDLSEMYEFEYDVPDSNNIERELLKRYFDKNHSFRHKQVNIRERCLWDNNPGFPAIITGGTYNEHFPGNAYRNMSALIADTVTYNLDYRTTLNNNDYLWSFGFGYGDYNYCSTVGYSIDFASSSNSIKSVFAGFMGSFFGDWDTANSFLRAPLAAKGNVLNTFWSGRPAWFFHHMGLGETIGYSTLRTQNNYDSVYSGAFVYPLYPVMAYSPFQVHPSLMGDPTVRMQPVMPISNLLARQDSCNFRFRLDWTASTDTAVHTYYVFRSKHIDSTFTLMTTTANTFYIDNSPLTGDNVYMVRALKLQTSGSGTYFNLSQGLFDTISTSEYFIPTANAGLDTTVCQNQAVRIGVHNANNIHTTYLWTPGNYTRDTVTIPVISAGTRVLFATDTLSGCVRTDSVTLATIALPASETLSSNSNFCNDTVTWSSTSNNGSSYRYEWTFSGGYPNDSIGFGLSNPGTILYGTAGTYQTTLSVRDTVTNCANTMISSVGVICVGLPVEWANLICEREGDRAVIGFNIAEFETINEVYIEVLSGNFEWIRLESFRPESNGRYLKYIENSNNFIGVRLLALMNNGEYDELDKCMWDDDNLYLNVYPNPMNEELNVNFKSNNHQVSEVIVYNALGQIVYDSKYSFANGNLKIDGEKWNSGLYTIVIINGKKVHSRQFVK